MATMKKEEFEKYLKSIGGLINGYRANRGPIITNICECEDGWLQLIHDLIEELILLGWDKHINQIKEKFGGLRFYTGSTTDEMRNIIRKYENLSYQTCEKCGSTDNVKQTKSGWVTSLCKTHYNEYLESKKSI